MKKHFVRFYSPGTFFDEVSEKEIDSWDVEKAISLSKNVKERYGSIPYGFIFITKERTDDELDSKITNNSPMYFFGGDIYTLEELKERNNPDDNILISNMENNGWYKIIENNNSYRITKPVKEGDKIIRNGKIEEI